MIAMREERKMYVIKIIITMTFVLIIMEIIIIIVAI